jgi:hypothetical protein
MAERQRQAPPPEPQDEGMEVDVEQEQYTPPPVPQRPRRGSREYAPPPPPAPQTERVRIEDAEYDVPPAVAAQVRSWEQAQARLDAIERSHQASEQWRQGVERAVTGEQPQPQDTIEQLWFTNPAEAARLLEQRTVQQVESRNASRDREQTFWSTFEGEHPELAPQRTLVQYLLSTDQAIATLPNSQEGRAQLAQAARERVLGWMQGMRGSGQVARGQQVPPVETGTRRRSAAPARQTPPEGPQSLKELQEMRSLARRQARLRVVNN